MTDDDRELSFALASLPQDAHGYLLAAWSPTRNYHHPLTGPGTPYGVRLLLRARLAVLIPKSGHLWLTDAGYRLATYARKKRSGVVDKRT